MSKRDRRSSRRSGSLSGMRSGFKRLVGQGAGKSKKRTSFGEVFIYIVLIVFAVMMLYRRYR